MSWSDFRANFIGPTNPELGPETSLRGTVLKNWQSLGLPARPDGGDNGVHASAGPLEGLVERGVWLGTPFEEDPVGAAAIAAGVSGQWLKAAAMNPPTVRDVKEVPLFDLLEDMQTSEALLVMAAMSKADQEDREHRSTA